MARARLGLLQYVHLEYPLEAAPDGQEESVEGAVPGPRSEVGVESVCYERFLIPLQLLVLKAGVSPGVRRPQRPGRPHCGGR